MIASHVVFQLNNCTSGSHSQSKKSKLYLKAEETCFILNTPSPKLSILCSITRQQATAYRTVRWRLFDCCTYGFRPTNFKVQLNKSSKP